jgi:hypothetical protein
MVPAPFMFWDGAGAMAVTRVRPRPNPSSTHFTFGWEEGPCIHCSIDLTGITAVWHGS